MVHGAHKVLDYFIYFTNKVNQILKEDKEDEIFISYSDFININWLYLY